MRLVLRIMETETSSDASHESEEDILDSFDTLETQVKTFQPVIESIANRIKTIQNAALSNSNYSLLTDAFPFRHATVAAWFGDEQTRITDFFRAILERGIVKTDLETRRIWLQSNLSERLGLPNRGLYFYELIRNLPRWLEIGARAE